MMKFCSACGQLMLDSHVFYTLEQGVLCPMCYAKQMEKDKMFKTHDEIVKDMTRGITNGTNK